MCNFKNLIFITHNIYKNYIFYKLLKFSWSFLIRIQIKSKIMLFKLISFRLFWPLFASVQSLCSEYLTALMLTETDCDWNFSSQTKLDKENKIQIINKNHDSQNCIQHCTSHITFLYQFSFGWIFLLLSAR